MLILAIEQSSDPGSVALLNDEQILGERAWNNLAARSGGLFSTLEELLAKTAVAMESIDVFAVDVGPGSYSGLRVSMAAARSFAMPGRRPIYAVTSAETLAFEIMEELSAHRVQVVGDARRRQLWTGLYEKDGNIPVARSNLQLAAENDFCPAAGAVVVSPDWHRLQERLKDVAAGNIPKARWLGVLASRKMRFNKVGEPIKPVYLHAAVK